MDFLKLYLFLEKYKKIDIIIKLVTIYIFLKMKMRLKYIKIYSLLMYIRNAK
jgi:hypothetical protein